MEVVVYFNDILIAGDNPDEVEAITNRLRNVLIQDGWKIIIKSVLQAHTRIQWMGKDLDGETWTITSSADYMAGMVALWVSLATCGYRQKSLKRLLGKITWADKPSTEAMLHTSSPMAWLMWGRVNARYTPGAVLKALGEAIAGTLSPWTTRPDQDPMNIVWYIDAAWIDIPLYIPLWVMGT